MTYMTSWSPTARVCRRRSAAGHRRRISSSPSPRTPAARRRVSLYLDPGLLERLRREDPMVRLHDGNVADYCKALEGVSHFLYLAWNAGHDRPVSILELEMQAEVDKYVASYWLLRRQLPGPISRGAAPHSVRARPHRSAARRGAGRSLSARPADMRRSSAAGSSSRCAARGAGTEGEVLSELRRFYRLSNARKVAHIIVYRRKSSRRLPRDPTRSPRLRTALGRCRRRRRHRRRACAPRARASS